MIFQSMYKSEGSSRRPSKLLSSKEVKMNMGNSLPCMFTIVDHQSISVSESFLLGDFGNSNEQFAQNGLMLLLCLGQPSESVFMFGDDDDVSRCNWSYVPEGKHMFILVDNCAGDFLSDEFIKDGFFGHLIELIYLISTNPSKKKDNKSMSFWKDLTKKQAHFCKYLGGFILEVPSIRWRYFLRNGFLQHLSQNNISINESSYPLRRSAQAFYPPDLPAIRRKRGWNSRSPRISKFLYPALQIGRL